MKKLIREFRQHSFLLYYLTARDFKIKYRRSFLGVAWSVLNPLFMMIVVSVVFSYIFRFNIQHFQVYLILGQTLFNFLSESTNSALSSITGSAALIKKVYMPKYIFPLEKVLFAFVNYAISLVAVGCVMAYYRIPLTWNLVFVPVILLLFFCFCLGLGLFLAAVTVFFRDVMHLYTVVLTAWTYLTPIFYPADILSARLKPVILCNPLYHFINNFRCAVLWGSTPNGLSMLACFVSAAGMLAIGAWVFHRKQDRFILFI